MKATDIREFNINELQKKEADMKQELFNLRFQNQTGQLENPVKIKVLKKDIARVKTVLREKMRGDQNVRAK